MNLNKVPTEQLMNELGKRFEAFIAIGRLPKALALGQMQTAHAMRGDFVECLGLLELMKFQVLAQLTGKVKK